VHTARLNCKLDCYLVSDATAVVDRVRDELARDGQRVLPRLASHTGGIRICASRRLAAETERGSQPRHNLLQRVAAYDRHDMSRSTFRSRN
jgi:hypothetical protein